MYLSRGVKVKRPLSKRQQVMLKYIQDFVSENSYPPTVRDIQNGCDISSTSVVDYNLQILEREGYLQRKREVSRGIEILKDTTSSIVNKLTSVPILGNIAAGNPLPMSGSGPWIDADFDNVDIPTSLTKGKENVFGLKVKGESMIDALVGDGDLVLIEPTEQARNGEMVAAWLKDEEEATLKHFYLQGENVHLVPANSQMNPIVVPASNVSVRGRVVGVMRSF